MSQQPKKGGGGWGSLLSGAVAGIESRLDNILADEDTRASEDAARKAKVAGQQKSATATLKTEDSDTSSRAHSKSRGNDRLAERLAKAAKGKAGGSSRPSSELPSRTASPLPRASREITRASIDSNKPVEEDAGTVAEKDTATVPEIATETDNGSARASIEATAAASPALDGSKPASIRLSQDSVRPSVDSVPPADTVAAAIPLKRSPSFLESEVTRLSTLQDENVKNYQEELHAHLERIDALQAKLGYMAKQASAAAREAASAAEQGSLEKKLAEQEERNALLLEEGNKLSKNEIKQRAAIMKLRQRVQEEEKSSAELKRKLVTSEDERSDLRDRLRIVEEREKAAQSRLKGLVKLEVELDTVKRERDDAHRDVNSLKKQLVEAEKRAEDAEKRAQTDKLEEQKRLLADLNDDLANARLEKRLVEDRAKAEAKHQKEDAARQQEKAQLAEAELRTEIQVRYIHFSMKELLPCADRRKQSLETKLELLRSRTEEVTSSTTTDTQAKLLRQVETLQTQYSLASENWQTLESTLNSRVAALQKERDDIARREADVRKKAREANTKARRFEEDLDGERDKASTFETELNETKAGLAKMQTRLEKAEREVATAKAEMEKERQAWEREVQSKLEEERARWRAEHPPLPSPNPLSATASIADHNHFLSAGSPTASFSARKASDAGLMGLYSRRANAPSRTYSSELPPLFTNDRPPSRRTPPVSGPHTFLRTNTGDSSQLSREASPGLGLNGSGSIPPSASASMAPSIDIDAIDDRMDRDSYGSPHRTVNELVSHSTMAAGPSVQLVERMSAAVRRLESEKAASKEEHARLLAQRDEAREEVVGLMREVDGVRKSNERLASVEKELADLKTRYEASLEMLGEKSEEVEELRDDLNEVKKIYKEVLMQTGGAK
jgi:hypothetical protein